MLYYLEILKTEYALNSTTPKMKLIIKGRMMLIMDKLSRCGLQGYRLYSSCPMPYVQKPEPLHFLPGQNIKSEIKLKVYTTVPENQKLSLPF